METRSAVGLATVRIGNSYGRFIARRELVVTVCSFLLLLSSLAAARSGKEHRTNRGKVGVCKRRAFYASAEQLGLTEISCLTKDQKRPVRWVFHASPTR